MSILNLIKARQWAMQRRAFQAAVDIATRANYEEEEIKKYFHAEDANSKIQMLQGFGDAVEGSMYSYIAKDTGLILIDGPIIPRATMFSDISGVASIDRLMSEFSSFENNEEIKKIVLLLDTPGGDVTGITDFSAQIKRSTKAVDAYVWNANSAGYVIASAADRIIVNNLGTVGSIGVVVTAVDDTEALEKEGIKIKEIWSSQSPYKRLNLNTEEGVSEVQKLVDSIADAMISTIAENRGITSDVVLQKYGQGRVMSANDALKAGMIDSVQDVQNFLKNKKIKTEALSIKLNAREGEKKMNAAEIREAHAEAVSVIEAEASAMAAEQERQRIKDIEALSEKFKGALSQVQKAVRAHLDNIKFNADMTADKAAVTLLSVVAQAQVEAVEEHAQDRRAAADVAVHAGQASADVEELTEEELLQKKVKAQTEKILKEGK
jgi:ClpP class serine protease